MVDHIIELLFSGQLRAGDRVDLDQLATELGLSRVPIKEALAQLERDGIVTTHHHRGAFISAFDANTVREAFELYALLNGLSTARVAEARDKSVLAELALVEERIAAATDVATFEVAAREVRRVINLAVSGPHLRALMRTFRGLVPATARLGMARAMAKEREYISEEIAAIRRGAPSIAARYAMEHIRYSGECGIEELVRMNVFAAADSDSDSDSPSTNHLLRLIKAVTT